MFRSEIRSCWSRLYSNYQKKRKKKKKPWNITYEGIFMRLTRIVSALNFKAQQYSLSIIFSVFSKLRKNPIAIPFPVTTSTMISIVRNRWCVFNLWSYLLDYFTIHHVLHRFDRSPALYVESFVSGNLIFHFHRRASTLLWH